MTINLLEPRKALNKAFLKIKPNRTNIEQFKTNLIAILDNSGTESEEFHKNLVIEFLKKTYYDPNHFVNTKGRNDLVIHNGKEAKTNVGVIIEVKSPSNKTEMISTENLNQKALQELVLYYLRERITHKNTELKNLVVSNIYEWFVFDAQLFNKLFAENKTLVKQFIDFEEGRASGKTTDYFYKEIAKPFVENLKSEITFAYFDIRDYDKPLRNTNKEDDKTLIALYKLLSPEHLLKLSFANDSNSLDKNFYNELLHIIGLTEIKDGGKKLIKRHEEGNRNDGSLLENAILQLESEDKLNYIDNLKQYGDNREEQLFSIGLELTITWVNRILFLKLLEAQLITYHKGDKSYSFLNNDLIKDYDNLNSLFFKVLAKKPQERIERIAKMFEKVPYLNSSLFETTNLERIGLSIAQLEDKIPLPLLSNTVIKDANGKKETGSKDALNYFFSFLNAYDFASEGSEDIQEDNKTLINASVLGLIFEKINGYKDGSFFTPSFITMYMCKETIRRAVIQKFNDAKNWTCETFVDLQNQITDRAEANTIINSLKICDPAVGSGHFLVSALNEIVVIKHELSVLMDKQGKTIHNNYDIEIVNDELIITDTNAVPFQYTLNNKESQRIQETLFHEKQTIIENCLFGVDINPNSVKICRLRLWIELLKNAYYNDAFPPFGVRGLETLPNIDINIKCGNSLISRFELNSDLKQTLTKSKISIQDYKNAVKTYQNAESKEQKREMETLIESIKGDFKTEINSNDPKKLKLEKRKGELFNYTQQVGLFERSKKEQTEWNKTVNQITVEVKTLETEIDEIKSNKIYENAFEWRFEFPEVLNDDGDFVGFDVVIGNPPYITILLGKKQVYNLNEADFYKINYKTFEYKGNTFALFIEKATSILNLNGQTSYIIPNTLLYSNTYQNTRTVLLNQTKIIELINCDFKVFDEAEIGGTLILTFIKNKKNELNIVRTIDFKDCFFDNQNINYTDQNSYQKSVEKKLYLDNETIQILYKANKVGIKYGLIAKVYQGVITGDNNKFISDRKIDENYIPILRGKDIHSYSKTFSKNFLLFDKKQLWSNTDEVNFKSEKLISRQTSDTLIFCYDNDNYFSLDSTHVHTIINNSFNLKYLLALMNSKFIRHLYKLMVQEQGRVFAQVKAVVLKDIPIVEISSTEQQPFITKVNEILELKKANPQADTLVLESEIDAMVYELYGLTKEEITIVEKS